jgi:rhomboid protease GluP
MSPELSTDAASDSAPAELVTVGVYPTFSIGSEHGLVVLAMGLPYWLVPSNDQFALLTEAASASRVQEQLARFDRESVGWPPPPFEPAMMTGRADLVTPLLWALVVMATFRAQQTWSGLTALAALDAAAVFGRGEIWRIVTALFLHADLGHLVSNLLSGIFVFSAVTSTFGRVRGWLLLALAAMAGNAFSVAALGTTSYVSIGASTGIFGALGLLTGRAIRVGAGAGARRRWKAMTVPLVAGVTVLALYGTGGVRVDVGAHLCGFVAGLAFGFIGGRPPAVAQRPGLLAQT